MTLAQGKKLSTQDNSNSNPISSSALAEYGLTPELSAQLHDGEWPARVVRADRLFLQVVTEHGPAWLVFPLFFAILLVNVSLQMINEDGEKNYRRMINS